MPLHLIFLSNDIQMNFHIQGIILCKVADLLLVFHVGYMDALFIYKMKCFQNLIHFLQISRIDQYIFVSRRPQL